jgi:alpha-glucoside transport system permease protein
MGTFIGAIVTVVISIAIAAGVFIGANRLIDRIKSAWPVAIAGLGGLFGLIVGAILQHNDVLKLGGDPPLYIFGDGWLTILLGGVVFAGVGYAVGQRTEPSLERRTALENSWRPVAFAGPAVLFIGLGLIAPSIRTAWLSFKVGNRGEGGFSTTHYREIFSDDATFNVDGFGNIFTSRLFIVALAATLLAAIAAWLSTRAVLGGTIGKRAVRIDRSIGAVIGALVLLAVVGLFEGIARDPNRSWIFDNILTPLVSSKVTLVVLILALAATVVWFLSVRRAGDDDNLDWGAPKSSTALTAALILLLLAVFSTMQSVIWNNLWWVVTVTGLSVTMGLLLAILADRARGESAARTMIFLPMAISMVGAAVIWDFMYELQATSNQTGLINAVLQGIGFKPRGFFINSTMIPWNNFWIMLILVWIQTGFAMVIFSSAIKGVPEELTEAARVDGATEVDVFWRIIIPQIRSTIVVVSTTLIIIVMKVFDLVKATTGGANRTNVLANEMFDQLRDRNFALSSAFAVLIFALTVPVMIFNVRRTAKEAAR